jgi:ABC-2 type transport system permease protein
MTALRALLLTELRIFARDRMTLFFTLLFPLVFVLIFGSLLSDIGDVSRSTMGIHAVQADRDHLDAAIREAGTTAVVPFDAVSALQQAVTDRTVDFGIVWDGESLGFLYDAARVQENYAFRQLAEGIATDFNLRRQGASSPIVVDTIDVGTALSSSWFSLVLPGILAFSVLSAGLFAVSGHLTAMKERIMRRRANG